jgi:uncharacterized membrane protein
MASVMQSIDVNVPVRTAYNQWTQFESFPQFMEGIREVRQRDDTHLHWVAEINGKTEEWDAEITEQMPDQRVAWTSTTGAPNAGVVTFHRLDAMRFSSTTREQSIMQRGVLGAAPPGLLLTTRPVCAGGTPPPRMPGPS